MSQPRSRFEIYISDCRRLTLAEIARFVPADSRTSGGLYDVMMEVPLRPAKALRPALCVATSLALGGHVDGVMPSAAAFELFHNAFLVHDDVEDGSHMRRHAATLHRLYGVPIAINVGDAMLALALEPLLDNVRALGLGRALRILQLFSRMARESAEGQMLELQWTRHTRWHIDDREYLRMVHKKTGWYSFIAPVLVGAIAAGASPAMQSALARFALLLGIAFQIQDDLLSLEQAEAEVGKDALGDLWEGKYTLALLHALRTATEADRLQALAILRRPRPAADAGGSEQAAASALHDKLARSALELSGAERALLAAALLGERNPGKTHEDVAFLKQLITARDGESLRHARAIAVRHVARAQRLLGDELAHIPDSVHRQFLEELVAFVVSRTR